jgi:hypothetical protein
MKDLAERGALELDATGTIKTLKAELALHRWIPVGERLPDNEGLYLTKYKGDGRQGLIDEMWIRSYPFWGIYKEMWTGKKKTKYNVTHWMPIPTLPAPDASKMDSGDGNKESEASDG